MIDDLDNVDFISSNVQSSRQEALLKIFEDNEAVVKMIIKGRSPTMRHVSRTHRVALDWLFDRINLDPKIPIKYIDTKNQLADILTKGNFTRDEWNHLLCLFNISHFSSINCSEVMSKRTQKDSSEERVTAKSKPMMNFVSRCSVRDPDVLASTASESPGKTRYESQLPLSSWTEQQPRTGRPVMGASSSDYSEWNIDEKWSSQEWKSDEMLDARTERPVSESPAGSFTQHTDKFVIDDEDMDSDTATADILTKGNFTRHEWNHLLNLFNISHFSSTACTAAMAKRAQQDLGEERVTANKPGEDLAWISRSWEICCGRRSIREPERPSPPGYSKEDYGQSWSSQEWKSGAAAHDRSGKPEKTSWNMMQQVAPHREEPLLDGNAHSVRYGEMIHDGSGKPEKVNSQEGTDSETFVMGSDAAEFVNKVTDQVRSRQKRMSNVAESGEEHSINWGMFMAATMNAATFMGKEFLNYSKISL